MALPDPGQELHWVAARLVELAQQDGCRCTAWPSPPWHIDATLPNCGGSWPSCWGRPSPRTGWAYNFSQGPNLSEVPLFQAALLPLTFIAARERREDLVSLLLSPYYGEVQVQGRRPARWDRIFRERRVDQGWDRLRQAVRRSRGRRPRRPRFSGGWTGSGTP